jgi:hypothetical protein
MKINKPNENNVIQYSNYGYSAILFNQNVEFKDLDKIYPYDTIENESGLSLHISTNQNALSLLASKRGSGTVPNIYIVRLGVIQYFVFGMALPAPSCFV